jgi:hypothetical protein
MSSTDVCSPEVTTSVKWRKKTNMSLTPIPRAKNGKTTNINAFNLPPKSKNKLALPPAAVPTATKPMIPTTQRLRKGFWKLANDQTMKRHIRM